MFLYVNKYKIYMPVLNNDTATGSNKKSDKNECFKIN